MPQLELPEIFIIAPYYKRLNQLKETAYRTAKYLGLRPILAQHGLEAELRWRRITGHIRRSKYVLAIFATLGKTGSGSPNIPIEVGYALARKPARNIGIFCHEAHRRNPLCFPTNLDGFDPVQFGSPSELQQKLGKWIRRYCPDRNERVGAEESFVDRIVAREVARGMTEDRARRKAERRLGIVKRGGRLSAEFVEAEVRKRIGAHSRA